MAQAPSLRVVDPADDISADLPMGDALIALATRIAAERPSCVLIIYERPAKATEESVFVHLRSLPNSLAVTRGLYQAAGDVLYPDDPVE